jgi:hypothetical protein
VDDLVAFLRARLDEDELTMREANTSPEMLTGIPRSYADAPVALHIARFGNPDRVLAEVEAKRELLRFAEAIRDFAPTFTTGVAAKLEDVLRLFARAYADHPDYRPEWAPTA